MNIKLLLSKFRSVAVLTLLGLLFSSVPSVPAQQLPMAEEDLPAVLVTNTPTKGTFFLLGQARPAPYPFDPYYGSLPLYAIGPIYWIDNRADTISEQMFQLEQEGGFGMSLMSSPSPPGVAGTNSGGTNLFCTSLTNFTVSYQYWTNNSLALGITQTTNNTIALTIQTTNTNASYDLYGTTNLNELALPQLSRTNWTWLLRAYGRATNFSWGQTNWCERYFQLGTSRDSDGDGWPDAYEVLVSKTDTNTLNIDIDTDTDGLPDGIEIFVLGTSPTNVNSARAIYEGVISNQTPSAWFKLNNESGNGLTNAISASSLTTLTNGGGLWDPDAFAKGNGAFSFTNAASVLTAGDVISGGTGSSQGSLSLLFRSLSSPPTGKRYLFSQKGGTSSQEFAVFVESNGAPVDPAGLKVQIGGQTVTMSTSIVFEAWHYLAMTWNETSDVAAWYLAPIGGKLTNGTINLTNSAVVGSISNLYVGNRQNNNGTFTSAFREGGNSFGALDEIAFWNRELTNTDVNAQFNTLNVLFQGPSKVFDLSRWNLLLPVDKTNQLGPTNAALQISTGWLNSGFNYVDPTNWARKYFYLSTSNTMVFEAPWNGARSANGSGARSELRETKLDGSDYNWLPLGTNTLEATCVVNSAGTNNDRKVIIGQAHSETASDPPVVISYNLPSTKNVTATYKTSPNGGTDLNLTLATNVNVLDQIHYQIRLNDNGTNVNLHVEASVNGVPQTATDQQDRTLIPYSSWHTNTFYFKAGCYYPTNGSGSPIAGTAKVTFSSLKATHHP